MKTKKKTLEPVNRCYLYDGTSRVFRFVTESSKSFSTRFTFFDKSLIRFIKCAVRKYRTFYDLINVCFKKFFFFEKIFYELHTYSEYCPFLILYSDHNYWSSSSSSSKYQTDGGKRSCKRWFRFRSPREWTADKLTLFERDSERVHLIRYG